MEFGTKWFTLLLLLTYFTQTILFVHAQENESTQQLLPSTQIATSTPTPSNVYDSSASPFLASLTLLNVILIALSTLFIVRSSSSQ